eukprot:CAMPEP_0204193172 /NCGR_PEP_ID=MMETSP0361-20130328/61467_1 /ASSEMBLY_ACC=CAM_ASM_000343 /TAXON_ID=268821 /ORGANISM="Scrippsiella Hangoei, Strain SHTV-5" /LENGTH=93 /DNA_ID=CAMNT_0051154349 /DNA_START=48 /DNA_END=329 /DNA_ORIENTATION=+
MAINLGTCSTMHRPSSSSTVTSQVRSSKRFMAAISPLIIFACTKFLAPTVMSACTAKLKNKQSARTFNSNGQTFQTSICFADSLLVTCTHSAV